MMISIVNYLRELQSTKNKVTTEQNPLFEYEVYKLIPGTKSSYRSDSGNTNTKVLAHSHVYAKPKGTGNQLYALNIDGSGHDGSSNVIIPQAHADHFRKQGYKIGDNNILECLDFENLIESKYSLIIIERA
ncbi:MAG: hypothetical protein JXR40_09820 [Pontiellaceae bacterium]|nr:hypothetical protein [Pontiellaceae bacterium]